MSDLSDADTLQEAQACRDRPPRFQRLPGNGIRRRLVRRSWWVRTSALRASRRTRRQSAHRGVSAGTCVSRGSVPKKLFVYEPRLMPAKYARPFSKGQKHDDRDAEANAEAGATLNHEVRCNLDGRTSSICRRCTGFASGFSVSARTPTCDANRRALTVHVA
jgi:hypothetical protein